VSPVEKKVLAALKNLGPDAGAKEIGQHLDRSTTQVARVIQQLAAQGLPRERRRPRQAARVMTGTPPLMPRAREKRPEANPYTEVIRGCLKCGKSFLAIGRLLRLCPSCRAANDPSLFQDRA
jgi:hypothetical protein